ncbi:MAG: SpoIIE family protein phosphatase [Pseudomonadales bacterium]
MGCNEHSILLIDDEDIVRESIAAYLEDLGFTVYAARDEEEGLALFYQQQPDVVLCDIVPNIDGLGVLKEIKAASSDIPIIVISGVGVMSDVVEALRYGASDYLIKPIVDMEVLKHAVVRCLEQGKLRRENIDYRQQLEQANQGLQQNLKVLEQDQQAGRHVQMKMLPPSPKQFGDFHFSHKIVPSLYISGDFVDYFTVGDDHVVFFIADVSGHGASSAFLTVLLKNLFARKRSDYLHLNDKTILSPVKILERANQDLLTTEIGKHATLCVGVLDLTRNTLMYSVAGHLPLPILVANGRCDYLQGEGMPVGLFESAKYTENMQLLPENFVLTLFSDGILEVVNAEGVLEQEKYLLEKLTPGQDSIASVVNALGLDDVVEAPDDIAVLLISR